MDGVGAVAVVALGVICVAQEWALIRLVSRLLPPPVSQYRASSVRASQPRTAASPYDETRTFRHHPSTDSWPVQGDTDERP